jgi:4-hydroxyphenylacetate 3-monooxygenase
VSSALDARESAFELHANGGIPVWRGRIRRCFERYNELANSVLKQTSVPMPEIDLSSLRETAYVPRRVVTPPVR